MVENGAMDATKKYRGKINSVIMSYVKDMETDLGSESADKTLADYRLLIEEGRGKSEEAVILRKKLEGLFGANHEELQRADIMLQLF